MFQIAVLQLCSLVRHVSPSFDLRVTFRKSNISSPLCAARPVPDQGTQIATKATFAVLSSLHNLLVTCRITKKGRSNDRPLRLLYGGPARSVALISAPYQ
jgi:hypothetical protein